MIWTILRRPAIIVSLIALAIIGAQQVALHRAGSRVDALVVEAAELSARLDVCNAEVSGLRASVEEAELQAQAQANRARLAEIDAAHARAKSERIMQDVLMQPVPVNDCPALVRWFDTTGRKLLERW